MKGSRLVRVGVIDIGSNSVRLDVVDAVAGGPPLPVYGEKSTVKLAERTNKDGAISERGASALMAALEAQVSAAESHDASELLIFATAALREATNAEDLLGQVKSSLGVDIAVLSGRDEARFTFLAARRWFGWRGGSLLLMDIGGGSLEIARGRDERPEIALSLPLGAGRLRRLHIRHDPPTEHELDEIRREARSAIRQVTERLRWEGRPSSAVATSGTLRRLARLTGAPRRRKGPCVRRYLKRQDLRRLIPRLANMESSERARLSSVSHERANQLIAGAIVAEEAMSALDLMCVEISPWALREGILIQRLDILHDREALHAGALITKATQDPSSEDAEGSDPATVAPVGADQLARLPA